MALSDKAKLAGALVAHFHDPTMQEEVLATLRMLYPGADFGITKRGGLAITIKDPDLVLPRAVGFHASLILKPTDDPDVWVATKNREGTETLFRNEPPAPLKSTWDWVRNPAL